MAACLCRHGQPKCRSHPGVRRLQDQLNPTIHGMSSPSPVHRRGGRPGATGDTQSSGVGSARARPGNRGAGSWRACRRWRRAGPEVSGAFPKNPRAPRCISPPGVEFPSRREARGGWARRSAPGGPARCVGPIPTTTAPASPARPPAPVVEGRLPEWDE